MVKHNSQRALPQTKGRSRKSGFTLVQLLVVMAVVSSLAVASVGVMRSAKTARGTAKRTQCDVHLKTIVMALDTFRQENGVSPKNLGELSSKKYITQDMLQCPSDPELASHAGQATYSSYANYYMVRDPRDSGELPVVVCPFHDDNGPIGAQGYKGNYSTQYATRTALLKSTDYTGVVTIIRPGQGVLSLPKNGATLLLRGGDRVVTGAGVAKVNFVDGSYALINNSTDITVLESYMEGQRSGPLYTLVRQVTGKVNYYVNPGSFFDVATPTATAGALGTKFTLQILGASAALGGQKDTLLTVQLHKVAFTSNARTVEVKDSDPGVKASQIPTLPEKPRTKGAGSYNGDPNAVVPRSGDSSGNGNSGNGNSGSGNNGGSNNSGSGNNGGGNNTGGGND